MHEAMSNLFVIEAVVALVLIAVFIYIALYGGDDPPEGD